MGRVPLSHLRFAKKTVLPMVNQNNSNKCCTTILSDTSHCHPQLPAEQVTANPIEGVLMDKASNQPGERTAAASQSTGDPTAGTTLESG